MISVIISLLNRKSFLIVFAALSFSLLEGKAFAVWEDVLNLKNTRAETEVKEHFKCDIACYGQSRDVGILTLKVIRNSDDGQYYLKGHLWSNSCHTWTDRTNSEHPGGIKFATYGSIQEGQDANGEPLLNREGCGFNEIKFLLPITRNNDGSWKAHYQNMITDTDEGARVPELITLPWRMAAPPADISRLYRGGAYLWYYGSRAVLIVRRAAQYISGSGPFAWGGLYFDIGKLFELCSEEFRRIPN